MVGRWSSGPHNSQSMGTEGALSSDNGEGGVGRGWAGGG